MRRLREAGRFIGSLLALALVVVWGANPILAQTSVLPGGGASFTGGALTSATTLADDILLTFGTAGDTTRPAIALVTAETPDTGMLLTGTVSNHWIIAENQDKAFDFAHAAATDPTLFIHSHNQSTSQYLALLNDGANGYIDANGTNVALVVRSAGTNKVLIGATEVRVASGSNLGFSANADPNVSANDAFFKRGGAAAKIQMGTDLNGAAINQTFTACNGITGTDILGCGLTQGAGLGTGAGVSNPYTITRQITKATGTTAQTSAPAMVVCPSKILSNTTGTVQTIATITTTTTTAGGLEWIYNVIASNGTALDSDTGDMNISWNNNAATVAVAASAALGDVQSNGSGTLTAAQTATVATNVISLKYTPAWTVIVPTVVTGFATFIMHSSGDTVVCQ